MAGLLDYLSAQKDSAMNDYAGLMDNYPNAKKFAKGLVANIAQHIPSNDDLKSPEAMRQWSMAAAMNAPMGLTFIGPKSAAWNSNAADNAKFMLENGYNPAQVWRDHMTGVSPDGKTLFQEIDGGQQSPLTGDAAGGRFISERYQKMLEDAFARTAQERVGMDMMQRRENYPFNGGFIGGSN
ncbi:MAG: hypothetical protein ACXWAT_00070 [Methylobacter sp.]